MFFRHLVSAPAVLAAALPLLALAAPASGQPQILTERYDNNRTGANLGETVLTPASVAQPNFGKIGAWRVAGSVQAQPLYMSGLAIQGVGTRNVLFVATMNDVVYALDADAPGSTPLWSIALTSRTPRVTPVPIASIVGANDLNIVGNVGITSTPVIDAATGTIYLVARTREGQRTVQRLHALDVTTGAEKLGGPVEITASVPGNGWGSTGGTVSFDPLIHNQRVSLALANNQVLIGWGSHEDANAYHGWLMSYDATSLRQTGVFCTSPNGRMSAIWMSGHAPVIDAKGNAYVMTGNGSWDGATEFGESFLKFSTTGGIALTDWFTPDNYDDLNNRDADLGSSGPLLIPNTNALIGAGKDGLFYVLTTGALGHEQSGNGQIRQILDNGGGEVKGGAVYWNRAGAGASRLYVWTDCTSARAYRWNGSGFNSTPVAQSQVQSACGASNGVLTLSANGTDATSGILWSSMVATADGDHGVHHGVLRALNAVTLAEIWNSDTRTRDYAGNWPKFSPPVVANGRVYLASFPLNGTGPGLIQVFGLRR